MGIKRYYATKDNTITNAFKSNLQTRGVSGNMGQSDILEIFSIYAQANTSSSELSRVLIEFDTAAINTDRTVKTIPASGSVSFFLKMYNAENFQTTPKNFDLSVQAVSQSWNEGLGLDMEEYSDEDASNWLSASSGTPWAEFTGRATASIVTVVKELLTAGTFTLTDAAGTSTTYGFVTGVDVSANTTAYTPGTTVNIGIDGMAGGDAGATADQIIARINAGTNIGFTASKTGNNVTVTQNTPGTVGNKTNAQDSGMGAFVVNNFANGTDTPGGSYKPGSDAAPTEYLFTQSFDTGFEDLEVDVSHLVEDWIKGESAGGYTNYGFGVQLASALESATNSYYTKMFFARGSQFFHKRPVIEARWDDTKKDHRGDFFLSSSLVPASDNLMNLYLYNVVKGQLTDIPKVGTGNIRVSIYSGSTAPAGNKLKLPPGGGVVADGHINITGSHVETGIYSCSFAYASSSITTIFDVWHSGTVEYHTGSAISVKTFDSKDFNFDQKYVSKVTNLRAVYDKNEKVRFRLYTREKDPSPTIYTVANKEIQTSIIDDAYYRFTRVSDNLEVIPFGTGSLNHTRLSYDVSGSYFDLEMNMFDLDTVYELSFAYLVNGSYVEQPERFRFRVE
tara:strand:+ start:12745 stop:14604 length:1860 start_codon:yes stop_codon:yes gene_type:complete